MGIRSPQVLRLPFRSSDRRTLLGALHFLGSCLVFVLLQDGCLTAREMTALGIEKHVQQQILNYLATTVKCVRPNAGRLHDNVLYLHCAFILTVIYGVFSGSFNYVSDWLCSLELTDYLGNFVTAGLKSMLIVRTTDLTRDHLEVRRFSFDWRHQKKHPSAFLTKRA